MQMTVKRVRTIVENSGGRVSWGNSGLIAYGGYGEDGYYDLWTIKPDGSEAKCLTHGNKKIAQLHNGQPTWHPFGKYIIFQSQDPSLPRSPEFDASLADPASGTHSNLWATDPEGNHFFQLTHIKAGESTLHAHFSHDGKKLTWSQNLGIMIADFSDSPEPHLENIRELHPVKNWPETHSFSPDNSKLLFTEFYPEGGDQSPDERGDAKSWMLDLMLGKFRLATAGIKELDLKTETIRHVAGSPESWDEHAHYSPDGKKIVWASSKSYPYDGKTMMEVLTTTRLDYWIMDADGSNMQKLTHFNDPRHPHYIGGDPIVKGVDFSWSPDGKKIVACLLRGETKELASVVVVELVD